MPTVRIMLIWPKRPLVRGRTGRFIPKPRGVNALQLAWGCAYLLALSAGALLGAVAEEMGNAEADAAERIYGGSLRWE